MTTSVLPLGPRGLGRSLILRIPDLDFLGDGGKMSPLDKTGGNDGDNFEAFLSTTGGGGVLA